MKMVIAYIRHEAFEPIRTELLSLGFPSLSISEVKGSGRQKGITERYRGAELTNYLRPKVKIECVVASRDLMTIVDTILKHGRTGAVGDGKVFVLPVEEAYRIRTGESGEETLQAHPDAAGRGGRLGGGEGGRPHSGHPCRAAEGAASADGRRRPRRRRPGARRRAGRRSGRRHRGDRRAAARRCGHRAAGHVAAERLPELRRYVGDCVADRLAHPPRGLAIEIPIASGDETVGCVLLLEGASAPIGEASEYLHLAAVASLTEVAVEEARDEVEQNLRGSFLEDLRAGAGLAPDELVRRAARLGCDLSRGAVALCAELHTDRPRHVVATIGEDVPGALAQHMEPVSGGSQSGRVYALLPALAGDNAAEATLAAAARLAARLQRHGTVGLSSFYSEPTSSAARCRRPSSCSTS